MFRNGKQAVKRQRTTSHSPSEASKQGEAPPSPDASEDEAQSKPSSNGTLKKPRTATSRSTRDKESGEKDVEKERAEAAGRRKSRAERRRDGKNKSLLSYVLSC